MDPHANNSRVKKVKLAKTSFQTSHGLACSRPEVGLLRELLRQKHSHKGGGMFQPASGTAGEFTLPYLMFSFRQRVKTNLLCQHFDFFE